jgi:twitching motility protein PilT
MMVVTAAIANLIRENKTYRIDSSIQTGRKDGMFLMDESLFNLWKNGLCDKEECLIKAQKPSELAGRIAMAEKGLFDEDDGDGNDFEDDDDDD